MIMERWQLIIKGKVQGVWYRANCREKGLELGLTGFVRNEPNGSVYAEGQGDQEALQEWAQWCKHGPVLAKVNTLKQQKIALVEGEQSFHIHKE